MTELDPFREWDAAYVLGALSSDERRRYERHLESCAACSSAVTEFAGIPGFLSKISAETATEIVDSPLFAISATASTTIQSLAERAMQKKIMVRRRLVGSMAIAAAFLIVIGIGIGVTMNGNQTFSSSALTTIAPGTPVLFAPGKPDAMKVHMQMANKKWGTQFQWNCAYTEIRTASDVPESYDLVVTDPSGAKVVIATWREIGKAATGLVAATSIPFADIRAIEIRFTGSNETVLTAEI